ncbi:MAG: hypothetical protein ACPHCN_16735, partial [Mycobacterium sp.]
WVERSDLVVSYDQTFGQLDRLLEKYCAGGALCTAVIIEDKAYQKGLMNDPRLLSAQDKWGFEIEGSMTGAEKNDPDIGVPAMVTTMRRREFRFPDAPDETTQHMMSLLKGEFRSWRPHVKGNRLEMDQVMSIYFGHRWWRQMKGTVRRSDRSSSEIKTQGLPFEPSGAGGLLLPSGFRR